MTRNIRGRLFEGRSPSDSKALMYPRAEEVWGQVLPGPAGAESPETFEDRVERAWAHIKGAFFSTDEYKRLRIVLAERISCEDTSAVRRGDA